MKQERRRGKEENVGERRKSWCFIKKGKRKEKKKKVRKSSNSEQ